MKSGKLFSNIGALSDFNYSKTFLNNKIMLKWKFMNAILIIVIIKVKLLK